MMVPENQKQKGVKAQASLEYMVMLALSLGVFAAILYVISTLISTSSTQIGVDSAYRAVDRIGESADFIYVHGHPSKTQINVYIPPNTEEMSIQHNTVNMRLSVGPSYTDVYTVTRGNLTGNLSAVTHEGYYVFTVESTPRNVVNITVF